jgi:Ca2+-binding RTX toxin-like protein
MSRRNGSASTDDLLPEDETESSGGNRGRSSNSGSGGSNSGGATGVITGDALDNQLTGGNGKDTISGGDGNDLLDGGNGKDLLYGEIGDDTLDGGRANDYLDGGDGNDLLIGGKSKDMLIGGLGDDRLDGGEGHDMLTGGEGMDTFLFAGKAGRSGGYADTITDFDAATGDVIELQGVLTGYDPLASTLTDYIMMDENNGDTRLRVDADGALNGANFVTVATLDNVTGLDAAALIASGNILIT